MKILLTGGAGFIGSHVADGYVEQGHEVAVVDNFVTGKPENVNPDVTFFEVNVTDHDDIADVFERVEPDVVNHHAAHVNVRKSVDDPVLDATQNVLGAINLLQLASEHCTRKFIFISSGGATYGESERLPVPESCPQEPLAPYGASKTCAEVYVQLYWRLHGLDYTILRYPNVYGPRQDPRGEAGVVAIFNKQMLQGETPTIFGDGSKTRDYVYVSDIVEANIAALPTGDQTRDAFNLGWGEEVSDFRIFDGVRRVLGVDVEPAYGDKRPGEVEHISLDASRAAKALGWRPKTSLDEGLARCADFYRRAYGEA